MRFAALLLLALSGVEGLTAAQQGPAGRWTFDGDAGGAKVHGRCEFVDSPIGDRGKLLSLNGVDAYVEIEGPGAPKEWTLSFWMLPLDLRAGGILSRSDGKRGWSLGLKPDGTLALESIPDKAI